MHRRGAFTLIELLTVLGIIVLVAGSAGRAMHDVSPAVALDSGQQLVASLLAAARNVAVTNHSRTMLVVNADATNERFLRGIQIAVETTPLSNRWRIAGPGGVLPRGIYVVPSGDDSIGVEFSRAPGDAASWPSGRHSTLVLLPRDWVLTPPEYPSERYLGMVDALAASGAATGGKIVLASARRAAETVIFEHSMWVRGVAISRYGSASLIDDGPGLDF